MLARCRDANFYGFDLKRMKVQPDLVIADWNFEPIIFNQAGLARAEHLRLEAEPGFGGMSARFVNTKYHRPIPGWFESGEHDVVGRNINESPARRESAVVRRDFANDQ